MNENKFNLKLVKGFDPILMKPCEDFDFNNPPFDPIEFSYDFVKFMLENNGVGLAANQVGLPYRIIAFRGDPQHYVCFNPLIVFESDEVTNYEEGCLSFPGVYAKIKRPAKIRLRYRTPNGDVRTDIFNNVTAKIVSHECEHVSGKLFFNNLSRVKREQALKKLVL